jgi:DNA polymerase zeta
MAGQQVLQVLCPNCVLCFGLQVKQSMKRHKSNKTLQRVLHSRQLGLKLIANVTYGYTAANFSGRMPCIEVTRTL